MEHTENIINTNRGLIPSLLRVFGMFGLRLIDDRDKLEAVAIRCINCKKETGLYLGNSTLSEMITKFMFNKILNYVGMSGIICSNEEMKYEIDES